MTYWFKCPRCGNEWGRVTSGPFSPSCLSGTGYRKHAMSAGRKTSGLAVRNSTMMNQLTAGKVECLIDDTFGK